MPGPAATPLATLPFHGLASSLQGLLTGCYESIPPILPLIMKNQKQEIADWLRDAHAMESNLVNMLEGQVDRLAAFPALQTSIAAHAEESKRHAELVEGALKSLGEDASALKDGVARLTGMVSPLGVGMASDAPVKIVLSNYAAEHFEIACYRSLIAAAESAGLSGIAETCRQILEDEEQMAEVMKAAVPQVTKAHLQEVQQS